MSKSSEEIELERSWLSLSLSILLSLIFHVQLQSQLLNQKAPSFTPARPPSHSSLPSLLSTLQSEYDSLILETYALKRNYDSVRQELAHALYANDAANRVVARLIGERDGAREWVRARGSTAYLVETERHAEPGFFLHSPSHRALAQIQNTLGVSGGNSVGAEDSEMTDGNAVGGQGSLDSETRETIQASVTK